MNLEARKHSLEDALAIIQATTSDRVHPLLSTSEEGDEDDEPRLKPIAESQSEASLGLADALGTLYMDGHGASRFFGPSGGSEVCQTFCPLNLTY